MNGTDAVARAAATWPPIVALPLRDLHDAGEPARLRLWAACDLVEMLARLMVVLGISDLAAVGDRRLPPDLLRELYGLIDEPTLGAWQRMAEAVARRVTGLSAPVFPELPRLADRLGRVLRGGVARGDQHEENSLLSVRNAFAHGGGVAEKRAEALLALWQPALVDLVVTAGWLSETELLVRRPDLAVERISGAQCVALPVTPAPAQMPPKPGSTAVRRASRLLVLDPLIVFDVPRLEAEGDPTDGEPAVQAYARKGPVRLLFTPFGSEIVLQSLGAEELTNAFDRLFDFDTIRHEREARHRDWVRGFEEEIARDARRMVGRADESNCLWEAASGTGDGVLWVGGPAGIGKSALMARLAYRLGEEAKERGHRTDPQKWLVLPYRFRAGDDRCRRDVFIRFLLERLEAWSGLDAEAAEAAKEPQGRNELQQIGLLLARVAANRVILLVDGLDEIDRNDPRLVDNVLPQLRGAGVLLICAGRPEPRLIDLRDRLRAQEPLPGGVPKMTTADIRAQLFARIERASSNLIRQDRDAADGTVVNRFVDQVAANADGLPIYVELVVNDILARRLRLLDAVDARQMPKSLAEYFEALIERHGLDDLTTIRGLVAASLTIAREPLPLEGLAELIRQRFALDLITGTVQVETALASLGAMVLPAETPEKTRGYRLYHDSLRTHLEQSPRFDQTLKTMRGALLEWCERWSEHKSPYALRQYADHLRQGGGHEALYDLARNEQFLATQREVLKEDADASLQTLRAAMRDGIEQDEPIRMAEFALRHARQVLVTAQEVPLHAAREGSLHRAWSLADLCDPESRVLWYMIIVWELSDSGSVESARATLDRICSGDLPRLTGWQSAVALRLLPHVVGVSQDAFELLRDRLVERKAGTTLWDHAVRAGEFAVAFEIATTLEDENARNSALAAIARAQAEVGKWSAARANAAMIGDASWAPRALAWIAIAAAKGGDLAGARECSAAALAMAQGPDGGRDLALVSALAELATAQRLQGDERAAQSSLGSAMSMIRQVSDDELRSAWFVDLDYRFWGRPNPNGQPPNGFNDFADAHRSVRAGWSYLDAPEHALRLAAIAAIEAQGGNHSVALATARQLADPCLRAECLAEIARLRAGTGAKEAARGVFAEALLALEASEGKSTLQRAIDTAARWYRAVDPVGAAEDEKSVRRLRRRVIGALTALGMRQDVQQERTQEDARRQRRQRIHNARALVAIAQAQAGEFVDATTTMRSVTDAVAFKELLGGTFQADPWADIAIAQIRAGDVAGAWKTTERIDNWPERVLCLCQFVRTQAQIGDRSGAPITAARAVVWIRENVMVSTGAPLIESDLGRILLAEIAVVLGAIGDAAVARETLALSVGLSARPQTDHEFHDAQVAVATYAVEAGDIVAARRIANAIDYRHRDLALVQIAGAQSRRGDLAGARETASRIGEMTHHILALCEIARGQRGSKLRLATQADLWRALKTARFHNDRDFLSRLIGDAALAVEELTIAAAASRGIKDDGRRADLLTAIALREAKRGDGASARAHLAAALRAATGADVARDWRLQSIARAQAYAGDFVGSLETVRRLGSSDGIKTLAHIARLQAYAGQVTAARTTAGLIPKDLSLGLLRKKVAASIDWAEKGRNDRHRSLVERMRTERCSAASRDGRLALEAMRFARASELVLAFEATARIEAPELRRATIRAVAKEAIHGGETAAVLRAVETIRHLRNDHLLAIATTFAGLGDKEHFKQLLLPCSFDRGLARGAAALLAKLYPERVLSVAAVLGVPTAVHGKSEKEGAIGTGMEERRDEPVRRR